jgi:hypothetical protein
MQGGVMGHLARCGVAAAVPVRRQSVGDTGGTAGVPRPTTTHLRRAATGLSICLIMFEAPKASSVPCGLGLRPD